MTSKRPLRIGIHGQRNAGKTCLFACLYGLRDRLVDPPAFDDEATLVYLREIWGWLRSGRMPQATAMGRPAEMRFRLSDGRDDAREVITIDYSGALVEPSVEAATRELSAEARAWLRECGAVLVLVDSSAPEVEQIDAVELLLAELRREGGQRRIERPLALVLTKWDTQGPLSNDPDEEGERLEQYFVSHSVFARLHAVLKEAATDPKQGFAVFPVSAFGTPGPSAGQPPSAEQMRPHQIDAPWKWAVQQVERLADLKRRQRRRRGWMVAVTALLVTLAGLAGTYHYADRRANREFIALRDYRQEYPGDPQAVEREQRDAQFLAAWWSRVVPSHREIVRAWHDADQARAEVHRAELERIERQRRHDELVATIARDAIAMADRGEEQQAYALCQQFLDEFGDSEKASEIRQTQLSVRNRWDDRVWADVKAARPRLMEEGKLLEFAAMVEEYLRLPGARNRSEGERLLQDAEWEMDRRQYQDLLEQSRRGTTAANLLEVNRRVDLYLTSPRQRRQMESVVRRWKVWFDTLNEPGLTVNIRVKHVSIPRGSELDSFWGMKPAVVVTLGERELRTVRQYKGSTFDSDEGLGPVIYRWGERGPLKVRVENTASSSLKREITFPESAFVLTHLNDPVKISDARGREITVILECREAIPPGLPEYGVKE